MEKSIARRLKWSEAEYQALFYPDGKIISYAFYGFGLVNMSFQDPSDETLRKYALAQLEWLSERVEKSALEPPYDTCTKLSPPGGAIVASQGNLLRAGYAMLGGTKDSILKKFHEDSKSISDACMKRDDCCMFSYPQLPVWPVDSTGALASLRIHDSLYGTKYGSVADRWSQWVANHLDSASGAMAGELDDKGLPLNVPRGCALTWALSFLPSISPALAGSQYDKLRRKWTVPALGIVGIREWYRGMPAKSDMQEGVVIAGIGTAASGLGIGAARANNDFSLWQAELRGLEAVGLPVWLPDGEKSYFFQQFLLGDILAFWGKTMCRWEQPLDHSPKWPDIQSPGYNVLLSCAVLLSATALVLQCDLVRRRCSLIKKQKELWSRSSVVCFGLQIAVFVLWAIFPHIFLHALIFMVIISFVDHTYVRSHLIAEYLRNS